MTGVQTCALPISQVEKIIKLVELESGKKLVMPDNYPISNVFPETMEMKKESPDGKKGVTELGVYYSQREKEIGRASCRERV